MSSPDLKAAQILADLRRLESQIGKFPSRDQYMDDPARLFSKDDISEVFGTWTKMLLMEGIQYSKKGKRDKQEIRERYYKKLLEEVENFRSSPIIHPPSFSLLVIGDFHAPYGHKDYFDFIYALSKKYNSDRIACVGDEVDFHAISFHDSNEDLLSAGPELTAAIKQLEPFYQAFPSMDIAESNHGSLVYRKGVHHGLPRNVLAGYHDILKCPPDWRWHFKVAALLSNGSEVDIHHSYGANVLAQSKKRGRSLIQGHHHTEGGVLWWGTDSRDHFAAFTGCGIDDVSFAFAYNKNQVERPRLGATVVIEGIAYWKPMILDSNGRWNKRVP